MAEEGDDSWRDYRRLVLSNFERLDKGQAATNDMISALSAKFSTEIAELKTEMALQKMKSSAWGFLSGLGATAVLALTGWLKIK